mgnify:CR=1 FL=1
MKQLRWKDFSLVSKIVIEVGMIAVLLFAMNMLFYVRINNSMQKMDNVYASNAELTELSQVFEKVQDNMYKYLKVKSSQTLLDYYQNEAKYRNELEKLNEDNINDPVKLLERNIRKMSETYLDCTAETVAAKRGRNVEQYKRKYDDATKLYRYIQSSIDELNNLMFQENSSTYAVLRAVMRYLEISNSVIMIIIVAGGMLLLIQATRNMFVPLSNMAETAQLVGQGNFHVKMHDTDAQDELGTVTRAFNTMVENLDLYMARTKASMEKEQQMMERELLMENHLKEAQLKYLQSQINPHFLYNTLDSIIWMIRSEEYEGAGKMVSLLAKFLRISLSQGKDMIPLEKELEHASSYLAIQNIRFKDKFEFQIEADPALLKYLCPKLSIQPLLENAIYHGMEGMYEDGEITIRIYDRDGDIGIDVADNGPGMTQETIDHIMHNKVISSKRGSGIGVRNVNERIQLIYGEDYGVTITSELDEGTTATITIPKMEETDDAR